MSKHQEFYPRKSAGKRQGRKVEIQDIRYYGYHQGFKIWLDGTKYPKAKGEFYTTNNQQTAINRAFEDAKYKYEANIDKMKFAQWGMSGKVRCQICGAILPQKMKHKCEKPDGYILMDGMWVEE